MNRWIKRTIIILVGGMGGFAYYYYIGCLNGSCPISSNPYVSTAYGALLAAILSMPQKKKRS